MTITVHLSVGLSEEPRWGSVRQAAFAETLAGRPHTDELDGDSYQYWVEADGRPVSAARIVPWHCMPAIGVFNDNHIPLPADIERYVEPSRFCTDPPMQGTPMGVACFQRVVGQVALDCALARQKMIFTELEMLYRALRWMPFRLHAPVHYGTEDGGPATTQPVWPSEVDPWEAIAATAFYSPQLFASMFPSLNLQQVMAWPGIQSAGRYTAIAAANAQQVTRDKQAWATQQRSA